jgi:beta-glucanase (GH16 family)
MSIQHPSINSYYLRSAQRPTTYLLWNGNHYNPRRSRYITLAIFLVAMLTTSAVSQRMGQPVAERLSRPPRTSPSPARAAPNSTGRLSIYLPAVQRAAGVSAVSANLLDNGSFETATALDPFPGWIFTVRPAAAAAGSQDRAAAADGAAAARITISQSSATPWDVQLHQRGLPLRSGQVYQLSFWARATAPRAGVVTLQQDVSPWIEYFSTSFDLTPSWQFYSFTYLSSIDDPAAALRFSLATATGMIWLDGVYFGQAPPAAPGESPAPLGQSGTWTLILQDEFADDALDHSKWVNCYLWDTLGCYKTNGAELEWYMPDDVLVGDGTLKLRAQQRTVTGTDGKSYAYSSGIISSGKDMYDPSVAPRFAFQYGYVEMQAQVPAGQGFWSAFWLLRADRVLPWEIDIFEILGHQPDTAYMTVHYPQSDGSTGQNSAGYLGPNFSAGYHTFALEWNADRLVWYVDGVERKRESNTAHIPHDPMYLIANLAVGGDWPGPPDGTTVFPNTLKVDYIRVWQRGN